MLHYHTGFSGTFFHPAVLQLTSTTLGFQPEGNCNFKPFEVPLSQVRIGNRNTVFVPPQQNAWAINLNVPNPSDPKKQATINLAMQRNNFNQIEALRELIQSLTR
jgi:hypothetical protein